MPHGISFRRRVGSRAASRQLVERRSSQGLLAAIPPVGSLRELLMDVYLLGPIEAHLDGRPIALRARKQRGVLAMLALQVDHTVPAHRLAEGLWGEELPPSAAKMVQLYVSQLRRLLDGNGAEIVTRGGGYELRLGDGEVDAVRFERLIEHA